MSKGTIVITCGPSYEPIDSMRRLTNASTGELGHALAEAFQAAGWPVLLLVGTGATYCGTLASTVPKRLFGTNEDLLRLCTGLAASEKVAAVLQAAALCDFRVAAVRDRAGQELHSRKHSSRRGDLTMVLAPAVKVLPQLRPLFPGSWLVGWKYELDGTADDVLAKGRAQLADCLTDVCVVNGSAYGAGFGALEKTGALTHLASRGALAEWLVAKAGNATS